MTIENKNPTADLNNSQRNEGHDTKTYETSVTTNTNTSLTSATATAGKDTVEQRDCGKNQESNKIATGGTSEQSGVQDMKTVATASYLAQDCVVIIIMGSSTVDKDTTIKSIQQKGYTLLGQHALQLSSKHTSTLYAYNKEDTKPHYQELYDGWKKKSLSDPVQVVILGKENAVQSFQDLMNKQNSTKKKERILDTQSVYASTSQDNVKRDIELLLGMQASNNLGDLVSSATAGENQDDTVTQTPLGGSLQKSISTEESNCQPTALSHEKNPSDTNSVDMAKSISDISISKQPQQQRPTMMTMAATAVTSTTMATATFDVVSPIETQPLTPPPPTSSASRKDSIVPTSTPLDDQTIERHLSPSPKISVPANHDGENDKQLVNESTTKTDASQSLEQTTNPQPPANVPTPTELAKEESHSVTSVKPATITEAIKESSSMPPESTAASTIEPPTVPSVNTTATTTESLLVSSELIITSTETLLVSEATVEPPPIGNSVTTESPPTLASHESNNASNGKCSTNGSSVSYSASADNSGDVQQQQIMDSATKTTTSSAKSDVVTRQESRDALHSKKKQAKEIVVRPTAKKVAPTETNKTNKTAQPALPIKSKLRRTTPATATPTSNTPTKQQQQKPSSVDSSKNPADETKKKAPRVPRVALLANQTKPTPPTDEKQQQMKTKPPSKISRDAISRLTTPTASSARRQQGAAPPPPSTPTRGTSVTATFKVEQRKRRPEPVHIDKTNSTSKAATAAKAVPGVKQPSPTSTSRLAKQALTKKKTNDVGTSKKNETPQRVAKKPLVPKRREATAEKPLTTIDTSTRSGKETMTVDAEKAVDDTAIPSPTGNPKQTPQQDNNNNKHIKAEQSPLSPGDSSTTSSRPQTPDHLSSSQDRAASDPTSTTTATTASTTGVVTLDNVNATPIKTLDPHHHQKPHVPTSKVRSMLTQFI